MHTPVLLQSAIESLNARPDARFIDATAGEGGHLSELLKKKAYVLAIDRDEKQVARLKTRFEGNDRLVVTIGNFAHLARIASEHNFVPVDGVLFDLGISMRQLTEGGRGLSYKRDGDPLDMRLDPTETVSAAELVNTASENELYRIFAKNSEEVSSRKIAHEIVQRRVRLKIRYVKDLVTAIYEAIGRSDEFVYRRIFQALRIEVNHEFSYLTEGLKGALEVTKKGGRIVVITFHSGEDRIVKEYIRDHGLKSMYKKTIAGDYHKKFERSAKIRVIEV